MREIRTLVDHLDGITTTLVSDHILNLLEEVEGTFPGDKQLILDVIDRYLSMPEQDRLLFQFRGEGAARCGVWMTSSTAKYGSGSKKPNAR